MPTEKHTRGVDYDLNDPGIVDYLDKNHAELRFAKFSGDIAFDLGNKLREKFLTTYKERKNAGVVIAIRTFDGQDLFSCTVGAPGSTGPDNWVWASRKEKLVRQTGKSSFLIGRLLAIQGRKPEDKGYPFPEYACHGGGYPIWLKNNTVCAIGCILVSGLPQAEDHQLIVDTLEAFLPSLE